MADSKERIVEFPIDFTNKLNGFSFDFGKIMSCARWMGHGPPRFKNLLPIKLITSQQSYMGIQVNNAQGGFSLYGVYAGVPFWRVSFRRFYLT